MISRKIKRTTYIPRHLNAGDIGENPREVEYEPLSAPAVPEPVEAPQPILAPELEPVPA